jgi:hypothetical protein
VNTRGENEGALTSKVSSCIYRYNTFGAGARSYPCATETTSGLWQLLHRQHRRHADLRPQPPHLQQLLREQRQGHQRGQRRLHRSRRAPSPATTSRSGCTSPSTPWSTTSGTCS